MQSSVYIFRDSWTGYCLFSSLGCRNVLRFLCAGLLRSPRLKTSERFSISLVQNIPTSPSECRLYDFLSSRCDINTEGFTEPQP